MASHIETLVDGASHFEELSSAKWRHTNWPQKFDSTHDLSLYLLTKFSNDYVVSHNMASHVETLVNGASHMENLMVIRVEVIAPEKPLDVNTSSKNIAMMISLFASAPK